MFAGAASEAVLPVLRLSILLGQGVCGRLTCSVPVWLRGKEASHLHAYTDLIISRLQPSERRFGRGFATQLKHRWTTRVRSSAEAALAHPRGAPVALSQCARRVRHALRTACAERADLAAAHGVAASDFNTPVGRFIHGAPSGSILATGADIRAPIGLILGHAFTDHRTDTESHGEHASPDGNCPPEPVKPRVDQPTHDTCRN